MFNRLNSEHTHVIPTPQDYLVLLPREYYEAPLLQEKITQPCTYLPTANRNTKYFLKYSVQPF